MRTRFVIYALVLAGLAVAQVSLNKTTTSTGNQVQMAGSAPGSIMVPPSCVTNEPLCKMAPEIPQQ